MDMRSSMPLRPLRVVLPGGSGHIGQLLARYFQQNGHHVTVLTRKPYAAEWQTMHWDGEHAGPWVHQLENADVCINLAGRSVNCRYTAAHQREIYESRIGTTRLLNQVIGSLTNPPRVWLNASTATIYRHALDREMDEDTGELGGGEMFSRHRRAPAKWNFSVRVAKDWERAFFEINTPQTRKIALRSAIVFSASPGGAFALYSRLVRLGLGGAQGSGRQIVSWIHEADFVRSVLFLVFREDLAGPFNLAAPNPLPNHEFMAGLREAWGMPNGLPAPAPLLALGAFLLRTETELVLKSRCVVPGRLLDAGFEFQFLRWPEAVQDLVRLWRQRSA